MELTQEQSAALEAIRNFTCDDRLDAFVLRGSAGTGKTTLIAKVVEALDDMNLSCALLAPTGRAARILQSKITKITRRSDVKASTIHRGIYSFTRVEVNEAAESANDPGVRMIFPLKPTESFVSLFVIDESSMVGDKENLGDFVQFGSGRLMTDLVTYARLKRSGRMQDHRTKLLLVGDPAQLPPVGESTSPALSEAYLRQEFNLEVASFDLRNVMRQARGSAILQRATELRDALLANRFNTFSIRPNGQDIVKTDPSGAVDLTIQGLQSKGTNVVVVHSNESALEYNRAIRGRRWGNPDLPIQVGETLLVNKNSTIHELSNGDLVKVTEVGQESNIVPIAIRGVNGEHRVELRFRELVTAFRGGDGSVTHVRCLVLENLLDSPYRELTPLEQRALLVDFRKRNPTVNPKSDEFRALIRADSFFNALQVKYGYAMTCHKSQGGEWNTAVVDFGLTRGTRNASFFRWAYTAITRAANKLFVVNAPEFSAVDAIDAWARSVAVPPEPTEAAAPEHARDPDWHRLSFSAATAALLPIHQQLRSAWNASGIEIERLQHLQYCERYTLLREGKRASVQYYYDRKYRRGVTGLLPGVPSDPVLAHDALAALHALSGERGAEEPTFIREFLQRLDDALAGSPIQRAGHKSMPYRLRVSFADPTRKGEIDFTYDGTSTWTGAQEVGGFGSSQGICEDVQRLMTSGKEAHSGC